MRGPGAGPGDAGADQGQAQASAVGDAALRTSDPDVYAAGDVAESYHPLYGRHLRVEHWANALNGGPAAARSMLGQDVSYDRVPYFFTDQFEIGMEFSGDILGYDQVIYRGSPEDLEFIAFWLSAGRVVAAMNVNVWDVTDDLQRLIRSGAVVDPAELQSGAAVAFSWKGGVSDG